MINFTNLPVRNKILIKSFVSVSVCFLVIGESIMQERNFIRCKKCNCFTKTRCIFCILFSPEVSIRIKAVTDA